MKSYAQLDLTQAFPSYTNPKGNADTELVMRTLKEGLCWLRERTSVADLQQAVTAWIDWDNASCRHSTFDGTAPGALERDHVSSRWIKREDFG